MIGLLNLIDIGKNRFIFPYVLAFQRFFLETARKVLPFIVTVPGRVGSETQISCEQSGLRAVIVEEMVKTNLV